MAVLDTPAVKSALRALDILELMAGRPLPMAHAQIAQSLGIPKSSLSGLLRTLSERGYLEHLDGGYRLGPRVAALTAEGRERAQAAEFAKPVVAHLRDEVGESVGFSVPEDDGARVVAAANADHPLVYTVRVGSLMPLYATSAGKAILARASQDEITAYLKRCALVALTPRTITDAATFRAQLKDARRTGIAWSNEERHPGIVGIAAAVLDGSGRALGALHVAIPTARCNAAIKAKIRVAVASAAAELARRIAGGEPIAKQRPSK